MILSKVKEVQYRGKLYMCWTYKMLCLHYELHMYYYSIPVTNIHSIDALLTYRFYILKAFSCQDKLSIDLNFLKQQTKLQVVLPS